MIKKFKFFFSTKPSVGMNTGTQKACLTVVVCLQSLNRWHTHDTHTGTHTEILRESFLSLGTAKSCSDTLYPHCPQAGHLKEGWQLSLQISALLCRWGCTDGMMLFLTFIGTSVQSESSKVNSAAIWKFSGAAEHSHQSTHVLEQHSDLKISVQISDTPIRELMGNIELIRSISLQQLDIQTLMCGFREEVSNLHAVEIRRMLTGFREVQQVPPK